MKNTLNYKLPLSRETQLSLREPPFKHAKRAASFLVRAGLLLALMLVTLPAGPSAKAHPNNANAPRSSVSVQQVETSDGSDTFEANAPVESSVEHLRFTRFGWHDPTDWHRAESFKIEYGINRVHPALFGVQMFLMVAGTMIWASDEWELSRTLGS